MLIACECSGRVREAFRAIGHDAWSCDIQPADDDSPYHIQGDVLKVIDFNNTGTKAWRWDMMIAFPPCTHLASSGARWFPKKQIKQAKSLAFVECLMSAPIPKIAIENPVGIISTKIRKPDQIIQPYYFGDKFSKRTCLWLKGLPHLEATDVVEPDLVTYTRKDGSKTRFSVDYGGSGAGSGKRRSVTYPGIAKAMANQWGYLLEV